MMSRPQTLNPVSWLVLLLLAWALLAGQHVNPKTASGQNSFPETASDEFAPLKAAPRLAFGDAAENNASGDSVVAKETTTLYRAVTQGELKQIQRTGAFEAGPNSLGGKWFAETREHARQWGDAMNGKGNSTVLEVQIPRGQAEQLMRMDRLDGIGPARYGELDQLRGAVIKESGR